MERARKKSGIIKDIPIEDAQVVILGIPNDTHSSGFLGSALAPRLICEQFYYQVEEFAELSWLNIAEKHLAVEKMLPRIMIGEVMREAYQYLNGGKFVVSLGGSHSVSVGSIAAHKKIYPDMSVLQLDAHFDLREDDGDFMEGDSDPYAHCTVMRHVHAMNLPFLQAGIRVDSDLESEFICEHGLKNNIFRANSRDGRCDIVDAIPTYEVYLTLDIDVLDSALVATGTPENRGWDWGKLYQLLEMLFTKKKIVGFDVVEVCPGPDFSTAKGIQTCYEVAELIYWMLGRKFRKRGGKSK